MRKTSPWRSACGFGRKNSALPLVSWGFKRSPSFGSRTGRWSTRWPSAGASFEVIRRTRPEAIISTDPADRRFDNFYRYHPDHRAVSEAVYDALYPACGNRFFYPRLLEQGLLPHCVKEIFFGPLTAEPNFYVDISETIDLKLKALECYRSQLGDRDGIRDFIRDWAREVGAPKSIPFAEAYRRIAMPEGE